MSEMLSVKAPAPRVFEFEGDDDSPLPSGSTTMTKYLELSASLPGRAWISNMRRLDPPNQGSSRTALDFWGFSRPRVRKAMRQSSTTVPQRSWKFPSEKDC